MWAQCTQRGLHTTCTLPALAVLQAKLWVLFQQKQEKAARETSYSAFCRYIEEKLAFDHCKLLGCSTCVHAACPLAPSAAPAARSAPVPHALPTPKASLAHISYRPWRAARLLNECVAQEP